MFVKQAYRARRRQQAGWKSYGALAVQLVAVLAVLGTGGFFLLRTHAVTIVDDGARRLVRSHSFTVAGVLQQAGVTLGPHDTVRPGRDALVHGDVVVGRGRQVRLTVDGRQSRRWVTARTVPALLADLGYRRDAVRVSGVDGVIDRDGATVTIRTRKHVTLVSHGKKTEYTTYAATVRELLAEHAVKLGHDDETEPALAHTLAGVSDVDLFTVSRKVKTETVTVDAPTKTQQRNDWMLDQQSVVDEGHDGKRTEKVEYVYRDGKQYQRKVLSSSWVTKASPRVIAKGTTPYPPDPTGLNWSGLAQCESGGNPHSVSANGEYMGLYQFSQSTWERMGGIGRPSDATAREQTYRAIKLYQASGKGQWPVCGANL